MSEPRAHRLQRNQHGLLVESKFVPRRNRIEIGAPCGIASKDDFHDLARLMRDDPGVAISPLSLPIENRQAVREARGDLGGEKCGKFLVADHAVADAAAE